MINMAYYVKLLPQEREQKLILKFFGKMQFETLTKAQYYFSKIDVTTLEKTKGYDKALISNTARLFADTLKSQTLSLEEKIDLVLSKLEYDHPLMDFLETKGTRSITCRCPKCEGNDKSGYLSKKSNFKVVACNHRTSCGYYGDLIKSYSLFHKIGYGQALNVLAQELGVDFNSGEVHTGEVVKQKELVVPQTQRVEKEVDYIYFEQDKPFRSIAVRDYLEKYTTLDLRARFMMVATYIYRFSKTTDQTGKLAYYNSIGVNEKTPALAKKLSMIRTNLGYLSKEDLPALVEHLKKFFPVKDLLELGVINPDFYDDGKPHKRAGLFKYNPEEGLVVIPNFDLYTDMCTGLKYRKTKLKSWTDYKSNKVVTEKNKEPEFSYGRIANPIPYHLIRAALEDRKITFRFFEGQKDLHSIPAIKDVCDVAIPGVNGIDEALFGLFKGRVIELYFDQDKAGQEGALRLKEMLEKAGAIVINRVWNSALGSDVNEVLQNGNIMEILSPKPNF